MEPMHPHGASSSDVFERSRHILQSPSSSAGRSAAASAVGARESKRWAGELICWYGVWSSPLTTHHSPLTNHHYSLLVGLVGACHLQAGLRFLDSSSQLDSRPPFAADQGVAAQVLVPSPSALAAPSAWLPLQSIPRVRGTPGRDAREIETACAVRSAPPATMASLSCYLLNCDSTHTPLYANAY